GGHSSSRGKPHATPRAESRRPISWLNSSERWATSLPSSKRPVASRGTSADSRSTSPTWPSTAPASNRWVRRTGAGWVPTFQRWRSSRSSRWWTRTRSWRSKRRRCWGRAFTNTGRPATKEVNMSPRFVASSLALVLVFAAGTLKAQDPVKVSPEHFKVLLDNERVRVLDFHSKGGDKIPL